MNKVDPSVEAFLQRINATHARVEKIIINTEAALKSARQYVYKRR